MGYDITKKRPDKGFTTVRQIVEASAARFPAKVFVQKRLENSDQWVRFTYVQMYDIARDLSTALLELGYRKGDHLAILSENRPEWSLIFLSFLFAGFIAIPIDALLKTNEFESILLRSHSRLVFASRKFLPELKTMKSRLPELDEIIGIDAEVELRNWDELIALGKDLRAKGDHRVEEIVIQPEDMAEIIFTSGTTGASKGVMLDNRNLARDTCGTNRIIPYDEHDAFLSVLPLHHTFETTAGMLIPLIEGCTITYVRSLKSKEIIEDMTACGATLMLGVPLLYEKMYDGIIRGIKDKSWTLRTMVKVLFGLTRFFRTLGWKSAGRVFFRSLRQKAGMGTMRIMISGAAPLPPKISKGFWELGFFLLQGYGLTETSPVVSCNRIGDCRFASSGAPIPECEFRIARPNPNGVGEVQIRGPMVMRGYYDSEEATRAVLDTDGWFSTGDSGYLDKDSFVYISGRVKNVIVSAAGKNIYPEEIESAINTSPLILESLVMGVKTGDIHREDVCAIVVPDMEGVQKFASDQHYYTGELTEPQVHEMLWTEVGRICDHMADFKRVKKIKVRYEELPKTSTRKIKRFMFAGEKF
jgi:long-chain acyl-CoA synthetase